MIGSAILVAAATIISPDPNAVQPVARPLCLVNVSPTVIVYAGDVKSVRLSPDSKYAWVLTDGNRLHSVEVPANVKPEDFRQQVADRITGAWTKCKAVSIL